MKKIEEKKVSTRKKTQDANIEQFNLEQRKAALLLDSVGEVGMNIFETWDVEIEEIQYDRVKEAFEEHFVSNKYL